MKFAGIVPTSLRRITQVNALAIDRHAPGIVGASPSRVFFGIGQTRLWEVGAYVGAQIFPFGQVLGG